ncbi:PTB domain-containing engulfment adapter protein 1-like [Syngnathoides biaculeatus]|uniref:PTB domain-containing engulfment adapter protein 1-like n=1 Tax=Syngnathoides biaculeatus TaxID=300417 RepID=UPI002ADE614A|nr:PTB domain-containing engulfment adapter protein 1-like [Syngnathoides biaculeatus]XP_061689525.1 PTB domain-containing engulfment adapter protein 1-like [Syngnathoides biaculeatus]XP_061689535.1 PTB domain-containing engulfment adapter protein 1-like [Syngnathoides biaculeatus]
MSDTEDDNEISFTVKFLGRVGVVHPSGHNILEEAAQSLKTPDPYSSEKAAKKSKVHLFVSLSGIDILENKTKFLLYTCPLSTVSFCAVLPSSHKVFGFVAKHPAVDSYHCYLFKSKTLAYLLVSAVGDVFRAANKEESVKGGRDLIVEALRHKNKMLQKENSELRRMLAEKNNQE